MPKRRRRRKLMVGKEEICLLKVALASVRVTSKIAGRSILKLDGCATIKLPLEVFWLFQVRIIMLWKKTPMVLVDLPGTISCPSEKRRNFRRMVKLDWG